MDLGLSLANTFARNYSCKQAAHMSKINHVRYL